jgi:hypothetical protein
MSKISTYIHAVRDHYEKTYKKSQTVADFADLIGKSVDIVLNNLRSAGVQKDKNDQILESDKQTLLKYLQKSHSNGKPEKKKIKISKGPSEALQMWMAVAENKNGSAYEVLEYFTAQIIYGHPTDPDLQRLVNLIVTKSFVEGALPSMKRGRPKSDKVQEMGREVAQMYWDLRDSGKSYAQAVDLIGKKIHKEQRYIMRMVEANTSFVGHTLEERENKRKWQSLMLKIRGDKNPYVSIYEEYFNPKMPPELTNIEFDAADYIEHVDELIKMELNAKIN